MSAAAGVHKHGITSDKMCKRYLFMLDMIVKSRVIAKRKPSESRSEGGPPKMLYLRELFGSLASCLRERLSERAGTETVKPGERPSPPPEPSTRRARRH